MLEPKFWDDNDSAQLVLKRSKTVKDKIKSFSDLQSRIEDVELLIEMAMDEDDGDSEAEVASEIDMIKTIVEEMQLETLLTGEYDSLNAILSVHAGTGGLDAQDWTEMLFRMYSRWGEKRGYQVELLDIIRDTEAGIKTATISVKGDNAYGFLKAEKGVHRLVRISPYNSSGKRQTSFASVDVMPEIDDSIQVDINPNDIKIDTYRASGAGGQHINKTDSAVRITHLPTGVVVQCQNQRSQLYNKTTAMTMLTSKLIELREKEQKEKIEDLAGDYSQIAWGSQIRSYVFQPYSLVKDHRTNEETSNVSGVMDGAIDCFINAYLRDKLVGSN